MKFNVAWANIAKENVSLKFALVSMMVISIFLSIGFLQMAMKDPIVIERSCKTEFVGKANTKPTVAEIKAFTKEALSQRYSSEVQVNDSFISAKEVQQKKAEEETFKNKKISQFILVRSVSVIDGKVIANIDRIFSMGEARPAYPSQIQLDIQSVTRSTENPYGLILNKIEVIKGKTKGDE